MKLFAFNKIWNIEIPANYSVVANDGGHTKEGDFCYNFATLDFVEVDGGDPIEEYVILFRKVSETRFTIDHNEYCELGDNWKDCPACIANFRQNGHH